MTRLLVLWLLVLSGCASLPPTGSPPASSSASLISPGLMPMRTIVVDAGHGGHDPGATHHGLREKDLALDIARRLQDELRARGVSVVMTRDHDEFIALSRRPTIANRLNADLFVSIHINANRNRHVSGIEVYYPRESVLRPETAWPPGLELHEIALPTTTVKRIMWDAVLTRARRQSARTASTVCQAMRRSLKVRCRGVRRARFVVLREAVMPAILVEVGYLSNRQEATRLASPSYRQAVAGAVAAGLVSALRNASGVAPMTTAALSP